jgi:HAD superfamily hydrolase (TIGR01509 family)
MSQSGHKPARGGQVPARPEESRPGGVEAVMFDMDGLLVDSEPLWYLAESAVMARLGGRWAPADQQALVGGSMTSTVAYLLARAARSVPPAMVARWLAEEMVGLVRSQPLPALPGVLSLLADVRAAGIPHALVTSSEPVVVEAVLSRLDVRFEVVVCAADVVQAKPDPEGYLLAAAKLGADPPRCIALEDSPNGVSAAEAAGYRVIAVPSVVPIPERPGRVVLRTLAGMTLARLEELAGLAA